MRICQIDLEPERSDESKPVLSDAAGGVEGDASGRSALARHPSNRDRRFWRRLGSRPTRHHSKRSGGRHVERFMNSQTLEITTDPSPTADATRLTDPARTSPTAKTPGQEVA